MCRLSANLLLEDTTELAEGTPLSFLGRTLEYRQADNSISLQLSPAFFLQLIGRYSLEAAATRTTPIDELSATASSSTSVSLNAKRAKLYKQTVGDLCRSVVLRPDLTLAVQQLSLSMSKPTEQSEEQLVSVLRYIKGTLGHKISVQPPRRWQKALSFELLAFTSSSSWSGAGRSSDSLCLFFLGVPLATSMYIQAPTSRAAELECVKRASIIASHTTTLLQDLQLDEPVTLRVLLGGPVAKQLGLSRNHRHIHLRHKVGQLQLSKVRSNQNLATCLTDNSASGLDRLLFKLKMHAQTDYARALPTVRCDATASFRSSSGSFLVGMVTKAQAMEQLLRTDCILDILGNQSLRRRTSSLEKKNFCFRVIQLVCLAFLSVLGPMILDHHSFQQRELAATYPYKIQSLHQQELVAASESLTVNSWSLPIDSLTLPSLSQLGDRFHSLTLHSLSLANGSLQRLNLPSLSLIDGGQIRSLQQQELTAAYSDGSTRARQLQLELSQKELATYALTEQISLQDSVPQRELTADEACKSLSFSPTKACFQLSAKGLIDESLELPTAQLCYPNLAERAYSNKSLHQLTLSKAQLKSQLQLRTGHLCKKMQADSSLELSIAQLCFKAQLPTGSIRACQLTTAQLCFNKLAWIRQMQHKTSTSTALSRSAGAFQQTDASQACNLAAASAATTASGRSAQLRASIMRRTTRSLQSFQGEIQTTASITRTEQLQQDNQSSNKQNKKDSFQHDLAELDLDSLSFSNQLDRVQRQQPQSYSFNMQEHLSLISFQLTCAALLVATLVARSLVNNSFHLAPEQLSKQKPHKGEPTAFATRPLAASSTRSTKPAWRSRSSTRAWSNNASTTAFASRSATATSSNIALSNRSSSRALRTTSSKPISGTTRSSRSLMTTSLCLSFMLVFEGIFASSSLPPSFPTSSLINCKDLELEKPHEHITSFGKKLVEKEELIISCWESELENQHELCKSLLQKETLEHLQLSKALVATQLREHLLHHQLQVQQLQNKQMQYKGSAWVTQLQQQQQQKTTACPAQLQQNLCHKELENKQLEFTKKSFDQSIFKRNTLQLNKFQLSEQQQQQHKTQLQTQIANQQLQQRVANQQLQQSITENQLQTNLPQVQEQLQTSNQEAISLQRSFDNNNGKDKIFDKSFQIFIFVSLVFKINFSASMGLVQKNFPNQLSLANSLGDAEGVACTEPPQLLQEQLSRRDLCQHSFPDSNLTEESSTTATSQTPALRTRASDRQLQRQQFGRKSLQRQQFGRRNFQRQQLGRRTFQTSSFGNNTFDNKNFKEHNFEDNTFDKNTFEEKNFDETNFEAKSFDKSNFEEKNIDQNSLEGNSLDKNSFNPSSLAQSNFAESSFDQSSLEDSSFDLASLPKNTLAANSFQEEPVDDANFPEASFAASSLKKKTFSDNSLETDTFSQNSFETNSFQESSFEESSLAKGSFEESSFGTSSFDKHSFTKSSLEESSLQPDSFEDTSLAEGSFPPEDCLVASTFEKSFNKQTLDKDSFQRSSFRSSQDSLTGQNFQTSTSTTELSQLQATPLPTELEQLECTSLRQTALSKAALSSALKSPASRLELHPAQDAAAKLTLFPVGLSLRTAHPQGGVVKGKLALLQLDMDKLEFPRPSWLKLCALELPKGSFVLLLSSFPEFGPKFGFRRCKIPCAETCP